MLWQNEETGEEGANYYADISCRYVDAATASRNCNRK